MTRCPVLKEFIVKGFLYRYSSKDQIDRYIGLLFRVDEPVSVILGKSVITLPTMSRIFKALGVSSATLDLGKGGKVALW